MNETQSVVLAVDVGGTKILVGTVDRVGTVHRWQRYPMDRSTQATTLDSMEAAVDYFLAQPWAGPAPCALGIGVVGQTDPATGTWIQAMNLPIATPVSLAAQFGRRYRLPVAVDNDVHAATLAELHLGAGRELTDFIYLNVGTGLAAGIVCNGQLVRGVTNYAGELGHMVVEPGGEPCPCGQRGCLEPIASGGGILAQVRARLADFPSSRLHGLVQADRLTASAVFQAADVGDELAGAIAGRAVRGLGTALTSLVNLLNPAAIVYGGGVLGDGWLMQRVAAHVAANALPVAYRALQGIVPSPLQPDRVGLLGAASLAWASCPQ